MRGYHPETNTWDSPLPLDEIFAIEEPSTLSEELGYFTLYKFSIARQKLEPREDLFLKLHHMLANIWGDGFCDLFYQQYSLADCGLVEKALREMNCHVLADLFAEAKSIYLRHNKDITEEEYRLLEPFSLRGNDGARFDEIAQQFTAAGSELFELPQRLGLYARQHQYEFQPIA